MEQEVCRLCLQHQKLMKKMHIIPEHLYSRSKGDDRTFLKVESFGNGYVKSIGRATGIGEYESDLVCPSCDNNIINKRYENYANIALRDELSDPNKGVVYREEMGCKHHYFNDVDFNIMRMYFLSILWRASISKRKNYDQVALGPYEEEIRRMLWENEPKNYLKFPVVMVKMIYKESLTAQLVRPFEAFRSGQSKSYFFAANGFVIFYLINNPNSLINRNYLEHHLGLQREAASCNEPQGLHHIL